ncbi:MAG: DUF4347 domain-containing protein, partial [Planctomycetales bacterium]|nr:DUF4347 domain-containing protein [Planctomycetales bacterium]
MSLRDFLRQTQMLIQHGLHMARTSSLNDGYQQPVQLLRLEERVLFSASPIAPIAAEMAEAGASLGESLMTDANVSPGSEERLPIADAQFLDLIADSVLPSQGADQSTSDAAATDDQTLELVFLDESIDNLDQMKADLMSVNAADPSRRLEFIFLDSTKDGIAQITSALLQHDGVDGLHIVSHGGTAQVQLGSTWLSINNLNTYRNAISAWQHSMSDKADILFYGCNLAGSEDGQQLLQEMSVLTDCDVAASEDSTGGANRNADWDLEYQLGTVTTNVAFSSDFQDDADFILATYTVTNTNDSGA